MASANIVKDKKSFTRPSLHASRATPRVARQTSLRRTWYDYMHANLLPLAIVHSKNSAGFMSIPVKLKTVRTRHTRYLLPLPYARPVFAPCYQAIALRHSCYA